MKSWQLKNNINHFELHQKKDNQITKDMVQYLMRLKHSFFFYKYASQEFIRARCISKYRHDQDMI